MGRGSNAFAPAAHANLISCKAAWLVPTAIAPFCHSDLLICHSER
jgi:hypothetical protein